MTQLILSCSIKFLFKTKTFVNQEKKLHCTQMCSFIKWPVILSKIVSDSSPTLTHCTFLTVLFISKNVTEKRDHDIFPIETYLSFKMAYLNKNIKIYASNTQILLVVQQISTKNHFYHYAFHIHQH